MNNCQNCNKDTVNPKFCCVSCSVSYNNRKFPKRATNFSVNKCKMCDNDCRTKKSMYCSKSCMNSHKRLIKDQNIEQYGFGNGFYHNATIRNYLIRKNGNSCMICGQSGNDWNGKPITLIVDHVDGKANNNTLDNLRIVCPNCDCQLPTYKAKNKGNSSRSYHIVQK